MKIQREIFRIIKWIAILILALLAVFFLVRAIGKAIYNQTPAGGINESKKGVLCDTQLIRLIKAKMS